MYLFQFCSKLRPVIRLASLHVVSVQVPQPGQLVTIATQIMTVHARGGPPSQSLHCENIVMSERHASVRRSVESSLLSHEELSVGAFPEEVLRRLPLPDGPLGFVVHHPGDERSVFTTPMRWFVDSTDQWQDKVVPPLFDEAGTSLVLPAVPVLLGVEDVL